MPRPDLLPLPAPDDIRAAIDAVDEQSRLLRRLLRVVLRLRLAATAADQLPDTTRNEGGRADE
jgi:hypothetical protein